MRRWFERFFEGNFTEEFERIEKGFDKVESKIRVNNRNGHIEIEIKGKVRSVKINGQQITIKPRI